MNAENVMSLIFGTILEANESRKPEKDTDEAHKLFWKFMDHGLSEDSKVKVYAACKKWQNQPERLVRFLKEEYGTGGFSMRNGCFADYNSFGVRISTPANDDGLRVYHWTWKQAGKRFLEDYLHGGAIGDMRTIRRIMEIECAGGLPVPVPGKKYPG